MNIGENAYNWFIDQAEYLVIIALVVIGIYYAFKREMTKLIGVVVIAVFAIGFVFNPFGTKDLLLEIFNKIIGQ